MFVIPPTRNIAPTCLIEREERAKVGGELDLNLNEKSGTNLDELVGNPPAGAARSIGLTNKLSCFQRNKFEKPWITDLLLFDSKEFDM